MENVKCIAPFFPNMVAHLLCLVSWFLFQDSYYSIEIGFAVQIWYIFLAATSNITHQVRIYIPLECSMKNYPHNSFLLDLLPPFHCRSMHLEIVYVQMHNNICELERAKTAYNLKRMEWQRIFPLFS